MVSLRVYYKNYTSNIQNIIHYMESMGCKDLEIINDDGEYPYITSSFIKYMRAEDIKDGMISKFNNVNVLIIQ